MPHITLPEGLPGILGPMAVRPDAARPMNELAEFLLRGPNTLTRAERELIATRVSAGNDCHFCQSAHGAVAAHHLGGDEELVAAVKQDPAAAPISDKLRALLAIADRVRVSGLEVTPELVQSARDAGATDLELHDTVLTAAAFCMFNRYVDGLATWAPAAGAEDYREHGAELAERGYVATTASLAG